MPFINSAAIEAAVDMAECHSCISRAFASQVSRDFADCSGSEPPEALLRQAASKVVRRLALPTAIADALLRQADHLRPFAEAAIADARHVAFRDALPVARFMA